MVIKKLKKLIAKKKPTAPVKKKAAATKSTPKTTAKVTAPKSSIKEVVQEKVPKVRAMPPLPSSTSQKILTAEGWKRLLIASLHKES